MKPKDLTSVEFYDVYGISLICTQCSDKNNLSFLSDILTEIANRYLEITKFAVCSELRYFKRGGCASDFHTPRKKNINILDKLGIKKWATERLNLPLKQSLIMFQYGSWDGDYGGRMWAEITRAGIDLEKVIPARADNIKKVINAIDYMNDLEHNNAMYLQSYCTFDLECACCDKDALKPNELIRRCSKEVRDIYEEVFV